MKNYLTATQEDYSELMVELENKGCMWYEEKPTAKNYWPKNEEKTYVMEENGNLTYGRTEPGYRELYQLIEYKAKGENMTQKEMQHNIFDWARDVSVAVESFYRDIKFEMKKSTVEADLKEAKSSAKKMIENIDKYLETLKPEFKVGDYVTVYVNGKEKIAKIDELTENNSKAHGLWYDRTLVKFKQDYWFTSGLNEFRHAIPTEIAEYKAALTFHKHGRKPFELKRGDVVYLKGYDKNIFLDSGNIYKKHNFIDGDVGLVKTVEEVNEWLEN